MNTKPEAKPVTDVLGPKQAESLLGPIEDYGPPIESFTCIICDNRFFDMKHYFYGVTSYKCMWCEKYGKKKTVAKVATKEMVDPKG